MEKQLTRVPALKMVAPLTVACERRREARRSRTSEGSDDMRVFSSSAVLTAEQSTAD